MIGVCNMEEGFELEQELTKMNLRGVEPKEVIITLHSGRTFKGKIRPIKGTFLTIAEAGKEKIIFLRAIDTIEPAE